MMKTLAPSTYMDIQKHWWLFTRAKVIKVAFDISPPFKELLSRCKIAIEVGKGEMLIEAAEEALIEICLHEKEWRACVKKLLTNLGLNSAKILTSGKLLDAIEGDCIMNVLNFLSSEEKEIMEELYESPYHKTVVTRTEGKILISSPQLQTREFCELDSTHIIGQNAKKVWLSSEWEKREEYLARDGFVNNFEYEGYRLVEVEKGNPQLHKFVGDFRLVKFYETECILGTFRFA